MLFVLTSIDFNRHRGVDYVAPITLLLTLINAQTKRKIHTDIPSAAIFENKDIDDNWSRTQGAHLRGEYIMFHIGYSTCPHLPLAHFQRFPLRFRREASRRFISPPTTLIGNGVTVFVNSSDIERWISYRYSHANPFLSFFLDGSYYLKIESSPFIAAILSLSYLLRFSNRDANPSSTSPFLSNWIYTLIISALSNKIL